MKSNNETYKKVKQFLGDEDDYEGLNLDQEDLIVWPLEQVQQNFKEFLTITKDLDLTNAQFKIDFPSGLEWPEEDNLDEMFQQSMSKVAGRMNKKKWKDNEKQLLTWILIRYCLMKNITCKDISDLDWRAIAKLIIGRNATQCKYKWLSRSKHKLVQVPWSKAEDDSLIQIYQEYQRLGKNSKWSEIAKEIALRCKTHIVRQGKQCRERWINKLDPSISKGPWSKEEELRLLLLIIQKGKKWSEISKMMKNCRTENALKNRYHTIIKKEKNKLPESNDPITQQEVIELVMKNRLDINPDNLVHLYEDIEPAELKIVLSIIDKINDALGKQTKQHVKQEAVEEDQTKKKVKYDEQEQQIARKRFVEIMDNIKVALEQQTSKLQTGQDIDPQSSVGLIKKLLKAQENDLNQNVCDKYYDDVFTQFGKQSKLEFEVEGISSLTKQDLDDCQFGIVDFEQSVIFALPQQYLQEAINRMQQKQTVKSQIKEFNPPPQNNLQFSNVMMADSIKQQQQQNDEKKNNDQFLQSQVLHTNSIDFDHQYQQYPVQFVYPSIIYPIATSINISQGLPMNQSYWMPQQYYPYYIRPQEQSQFILKSDNNFVENMFPSENQEQKN